MNVQTSSNETNYDIANKRIATTRVSSKPYWYTGSNNYANINIPPAFIEELQLTIEDEVTAEIVTTPEGPGILLRRFKEI